jgi:hypothetical protein
MAAKRRSLVLAVILTGYLLVLIDVSILMVALPRRGENRALLAKRGERLGRS